MAITQEQTQVSESKRGRKEGVPYPGLAEGKLTVKPDDFDASVHKSLKKSNFAEDKLDQYYLHKADIYNDRAKAVEAKLNDLREMASEAEHAAKVWAETGKAPVSKRVLKRKALDGIEAIKALREQMQALGVDLEGVDLDAMASKLSG